MNNSGFKKFKNIQKKLNSSGFKKFKNIQKNIEKIKKVKYIQKMNNSWFKSSKYSIFVLNTSIFKMIQIVFNISIFKKFNIVKKFGICPSTQNAPTQTSNIQTSNLKSFKKNDANNTTRTKTLKSEKMSKSSILSVPYKCLINIL